MPLSTYSADLFSQSRKLMRVQWTLLLATVEFWTFCRVPLYSVGSVRLMLERVHAIAWNSFLQKSVTV
jgi:hypothetical protein